MAHTIIGLTGKKQAGKSTVAKYLCEKHGFVEISFAEPIKEILGRGLFYFTNDQLYGDKKEEQDPRWGVSPRFVYKDLGQYFKTRYGNDFWAKRAMYRVGELVTRYPKGVSIVVSDCRFPVELEMIENIGGFTCRVVKTDATYDDTDETETALDQVSTAFELSAVTGDTDSLYSQADKMMEKLNSAIR